MDYSSKVINDSSILTDIELMDLCSNWVLKLCSTNGKAWSLEIPADYKRDPDMLFTELILRFGAKNKVLNHINKVSHV